MVFISHDVYFIRAIATKVLHIADGNLTPYAGDYQYYLDRSKAVSERSALTARKTSLPSADPKEGPAPRASTKAQRRLDAENRLAHSLQNKEHAQKVAALEAEILALENRQKELTALMEDPTTYASGNIVEINRELMGLTESLGSLNGRWESAAHAAPPP
ncbi:MAG: hypothetical protein WCL50_17455 [Spirochaetota bacterium]